MWSYNKFCYASVFLITGLCTFFLFATPARAQIEDWVVYNSNSGAFQARFPRNYTVKENTLRFDDKTLLYSSEIIAKVKEGDVDKTYMIKLEQTLGKTLTRNMLNYALESDVIRYERLAKSLGGKIIEEKDLNYNSFRAKDMFLTYVKDNVKYGMRIRILFTDVSRIYMVASGLAENSFSYRTNNFFETIKLYDRPRLEKGVFAEDWENYESPKKLFTIKAPPEGSPYISDRPVLKSSKNGESISYTFLDPILKFKTYYSVTGYIFDKTVNLDTVKLILMGEHVLKYIKIKEPEAMKVDEILLSDGKKLATTRMSFVAAPSTPYLNYMMFEAYYIDNILVIQELAGDVEHVLSTMGVSLFATMQFHPEKYLYPEKFQENKPTEELKNTSSETPLTTGEDQNLTPKTPAQPTTAPSLPAPSTPDSNAAPAVTFKSEQPSESNPSEKIIPQTKP